MVFKLYENSSLNSYFSSFLICTYLAVQVEIQQNYQVGY